MSSNLTDVVFAPGGPDYGARGGRPQLIGVMAEWLRRQTRNLVGSALVGSNPADVVLLPLPGPQIGSTGKNVCGSALCPSG